ncbi:hypothetical protein J1N35_019852 [Gossypium stocksii]|uniref:ZZ-type domain-containing protein n=1 Tax=Gossypium stocksii TaxID=47602 RepID=A0A9D3ZYP5_9ROSI|nr:hypothetical protein J1N35_019852 [Gossypium stocksii]
MESDLVIKVKYADTLRRFTACIDDGERRGLNMAGLRAKISRLFNFPVDTEVTLTYIDEDGDVVTLVDDDDLYDVIRQRLKFLRIDVHPNNDKLGEPCAASSQSSTPLRSPSFQPPSEGFNTVAADILKSAPDPLRGTLSEVLSKLSADVALIVASASPVLGDLVECLSKTGQSYLGPVSNPGAAADSSMQPVASSVSHCTPVGATDPDPVRDGGLRVVLPKSTDVDSTCKANKEGNTGNATSGVNVPAVPDPDSIDLNVDPLSDANLTGCAPMASEPSSSNISACNDQKSAKESMGRKKGKSVSFDTSAPSIDATVKFYPINVMGKDPSNECPFSGAPVANDPVAPPSFSPSKRVFSSTAGNVMFGTFHKGIQCDGCGVLPIAGPRFKSKVKDDYDLCSICFSKMGNEADYIRIDRPVHSSNPWFCRASNDPIPSALPHVLRNRALKSAQPKLESRFVLDVNVIDGTVMMPSTPFTKIWRMRNNGTVPWFHGMQLVWIGGDKLRNTMSVDIEIPPDGVPVDGELDIAVDFTAPQLPGRFVSYWRMASQAGIKFGQHVWVLIHVDASLKDMNTDNAQGLNLNFPPENSGSRDNEVCNSNVGPALVKPLINEQSTKEQSLNNRDVTTPIHTLSSFAAYPPIIDHQDISLLAFPETLSPSSLSSNPIIDLSEAALDEPMPMSPLPAPCEQAPSEEESEYAVEQTLLKELEDMGFKQVDLNKEILRMNEYDLEKSIDDLCGVAAWDPVLEELQEMGFCDAEMNKMLLKKNNGSITAVVMDLLGGEGA